MLLASYSYCLLVTYCMAGIKDKLKHIKFDELYSKLSFKIFKLLIGLIDQIIFSVHTETIYSW